jgi:hypothetical protein
MAKAPGKRKLLAYSRGLMPTKERQQKQGGIITESIHEIEAGIIHTKRGRALKECTLDHYWHLKKLSEAEYEAGMRFRRAYCYIVLHIRIDDYSGNHGDTEMAYVTPVYSERLLRSAYSVLSRAQKSMVISVCGHDYVAGDTYRIETLRRGLAVLAKEWKIG